MPGHRIPDRLRYEILERDGFRCRYCGVSKDSNGVVLEVDHVVPVSRGGSDTPTNLITACTPCNQGKGERVGHEAPQTLRAPAEHAVRLGLTPAQQRFAEGLRGGLDAVAAASAAGCARPDVKGPRWARMPKIRRYLSAVAPEVASNLPARESRERGGQIGNLNATKHPWRAFWRRRALRKEDRWVVPVLEGYAEQLVDDKGGEREITAGERRVLEIAQTARGAAMLILAEASRSGFTRETDNGWDLHPGVKELSRFLGLERQALGDIGLGRRTKDVQSLKDYLANRGKDGQQGPVLIDVTPATGTGSGT